MQGDLHQDEKNKGFGFATSATIEHFVKGICKLTQMQIFVLVTLLICVNVYQCLNRAIFSKKSSIMKHLLNDQTLFYVLTEICHQVNDQDLR